VRELPVSVVVPTLGRPSLIACVRSLADCRPLPAEVLVLVQGGAHELAAAAARQGPAGTRVVADDGRGVSSNRNHGLRLAAHPVIAVTDDDCTVEPDWIAAAHALAGAHPAAVLTGRVLPVGDAARVPSCKVDTDPHDFTGELEPGALYPNNMVLPRDEVLALGGFDERFGPCEAAEDGDFAYRWLRAGRTLRYEPALVVHHHDWRTDDQLAHLYRNYSRGLGALYGKHLRAGDRHMIRFMLRDARTALGMLKLRLLRRPVPADWRRGLPSGLPGGVVFGLRHLGPRSPWSVTPPERPPGAAPQVRPRSPA